MGVLRQLALFPLDTCDMPHVGGPGTAGPSLLDEPAPAALRVDVSTSRFLRLNDQVHTLLHNLANEHLGKTGHNLRNRL